MVLHVDASCTLCLQPWVDLNKGSPKPVPKGWWKALVETGVFAPDAVRVSLSDALIGMAGCFKLRPLFAQFILQCARRIELNCLGVIKRGERDKYGLDVSFSDPFAWGQLPQVLDHELLRRMTALQDFASQKLRFHISTDKANVNTVSLMNTLVSVDGVAEILPPQALLGNCKEDGQEIIRTSARRNLCFWGCIGLGGV